MTEAGASPSAPERPHQGARRTADGPRRDRLLPAYLVRGADPGLVDQAASRLLAALAEDQPMPLLPEEHRAAEADVAAVVDACETPPLFGGRRVVVLRDAGHLPPEDAKRVAAYLERPLPTTTMVLVAAEGAVPPGLLAAVRRVGEVREADAPTGRGRGQWVASRLREAGVRPDPGAVELIARHLGEDLGRLFGLGSVLSAAYGEGAHLRAEDVEPFLGSPGDAPPWGLTDAVDRGDLREALVQLLRLTEGGGRHPLAVLATLHRHYVAMARLDGTGVSSDEEAAAALGSRSSFAAGKALSQYRRLGWAGVARALQLLAAADLDLRGVSGWPEPLVLEILVARLCRLAPRAARPRAARRG
jgi:DNA polymerase-3 subunit delta